MRQLEISEELFNAAEYLAAQKNVTIEQIFEEAINSLNKKELSMSERIDKYMDEFKKVQPIILKESLDKGVPITYRNDQGQLVKENPDGSITVLAEADE